MTTYSLFSTESSECKSLLQTKIVNSQYPSPYNPDTPADSQLIARCTTATQNSLKNLQAYDSKILLGLSVGVAAFVCSWLLPLSAVSIIGFSYATYHIAQRQIYFQEYQQNLSNLVTCLDWVLNSNLNQQQAPQPNLIQSPPVMNMIRILGPLMDTEQFANNVPANDQQQVSGLATAERTKLNMFNHNLNNGEANVYYKIYGFNKGGAIDLLAGLKYCLIRLSSEIQKLAKGKQEAAAQEEGQDERREQEAPSNLAL